ncbi:MAG: sigma-70 family RNA polymerase sigma factor [Myxococcales bacterium]|nr:sigma-70 family RNA polymerase sigma factor [Myxococcales bacterium]
MHSPTTTPAVQTTELWHAFADRLRGFLRRRVREADVDDVLQEVFIRVHRGLLRGDVPRDPGAWLHRITRTTLIDHYRSRGADRSLPYAEPTEAGAAARTDGGPGAAESERELARCMVPFIAQLPEPYRAAMTWTGIEGSSQTAAAERAGISVSGMKSRVQRGRRQLAALFHRCCTLELDARGTVMPPEVGCDGC